MNYWLVKSEPETYSWAAFLKEGKTAWTGVRNFAARLKDGKFSAGAQSKMAGRIAQAVDDFDAGKTVIRQPGDDPVGGDFLTDPQGQGRPAEHVAGLEVVDQDHTRLPAG